MKCFCLIYLFTFSSGLLYAAIPVGKGDLSCAVLSNERVECWDDVKSLSPVAIDGIYNAVSIADSSSNSCEIVDQGGVQCVYSGIRILENPSSVIPIAKDICVENVVQIARGSLHTCMLINDGHVECLGSNRRGQVGSKTDGDVLSLEKVEGIDNATCLSAGMFHTCAIVDDGTVKCWGDNSRGQSNENISDWKLKKPTTIADLKDAIDIYASVLDTCASLKDGTFKCWGNQVRGPVERLAL